ncbi:serine/threonine-protein kinase dbf2, partial [Pichia californica]
MKKIDELNEKIKAKNSTSQASIKLPILTSTSEELSNEVGSLTSASNNEGQGKYIGAATGSNFAKMFLNQMHIQKLDELDHLSNLDLSINDYSNVSFFSHSCATLPPYNIAKLAVNNYVNFIHIFYPILNIKDLLSSLNHIYTNPSGLDYHEKYIIFMVIAIGLEKGDLDSTLSTYYNQFKPIEFYNTAQRYLHRLLSNRTLETLQELLLLVVWMTSINIFKDDNGDLWYLGRYVMSLAIELNLHKIPSSNKYLSEYNKELRNRLFWSTYILERSNAVKFGRGLSIRKNDIQINYPKFMNDDIIDDSSFYSYNRINLVPCLISIDLYEIYTLLLETIYISRTKGSKPKISDEEIFQYKIKIQDLITKTLERIDKDVNNSLFCYHELKIKTLIASIILNRPSPSFLSPDLRSLLTCKDNCMQCLDSFKYLIHTNWRSSPSNLHDLVNISLTMIFCCWKTEVNSDLLKSFSSDIIIIMTDVIKFFPSFIKFKNLYIVVSSIIIRGFEKNQMSLGMDNTNLSENLLTKTNNNKNDNNDNGNNNNDNDNNNDNNSNTFIPNNIATTPQQAIDIFSDVPSPLQQMKANMMMHNMNLVDTNQIPARGKNKRSYNESGLRSPAISPLTTTQIQFQMAHYPMKYSEAQNLQQQIP